MLPLKVRYNRVYLIFSSLFVSGVGGIHLILLFTWKLNDQPVERIFISVIFIGVACIIAHETYARDYDITFGKDYLDFTRLFTDLGKYYKLAEVRGFSKSKMKFGAHQGSYLYKKESIILYFDDGWHLEFSSRSYPLRFDHIESLLLALGIRYFGRERDRPTWSLNRKYKYDAIAETKNE